MTAQAATRKVPTYCYQCVAGPDLLTVKVQGGVATEVEPNFCAAEVHPGGGKVCVKAFGLIQKTYNPNRVLTPMKRTNPKKGRDEDPGFVPIAWDEAMALIAGKLNQVREEGLTDESGYPKVAASFGGGGTPQSYMGTFPAFLSAWGPVDMGFGSGQGVKCYHSEHLYGEFWHRAFIVAPDTPLCNYLISCGTNMEASSGVAGIWRHSRARVRGMKRVQVEPHLSITGACSAQWVPIKPKTDAAFLYALIQVMLHEARREQLDVEFLCRRTGSPYLVGPNGYFLRERETSKPLVWDTLRGAACAHDTPGIREALEGRYTVDAVETGPDGDLLAEGLLEGQTAFGRMVEHMRPYTPEWAAGVCDVDAATIRQIAHEYLDHACIGQTIEIDGQVMPYRPVAVTLGKTVNNGWGGYECCWARTMLATLVGALEVPGGTIGTTVRLARPMAQRLESVKPGPDGFMHFGLNPTDKQNWSARPNIRNAYRTMVPLASDGPWSQALGPTHFSWMFLDQTPQGLPRVTLPEVWFFYRTNPAISFWDTASLAQKIARFPFVVAFAYTHDETNHFADVLLPDAMDLESLQLIRIGTTKFIEQFWEHQGFALRQPAVAPRGQARDFTDIATELAARTGLTDRYVAAINKGAAGVPLKNPHGDFSLPADRVPELEVIWDAVCRAASAELTEGREIHGLDWWKEHGLATKPFPRREWYLYPTLGERGLRFELPYQERLARVGAELGRRLHENGMHWWDEQLKEYQALPPCKDFGAPWIASLRADGGTPEDFPFWLLTARSMQYAWGGNVGLQMIKEVADNIAGHKGLIINTRVAQRLGIAEGDPVEIATPQRRVSGRAVLRQGIRPDTLLAIGQFGHWNTPLARDFGVPSMNTLTSMKLELTDATGSGADIVRVSLRRLKEAA
ncbi:molybdopterin-dependent oxidoreductase [Ramlibacter tataouinensis]|uniref:molybdopterin-dependent oxidoreductase n=1 Tax=Ramlibacter tataouinensis TaxID=94132 RepID=UPI0022F404E1|nr:molybdopterin-dependent oxidoreductase [Ramlibacter tataouinensis]WBY03218.1 molybdopterin-dependent oxidoreductase [Ramlibacter tataouinensis]